LSGDSQASHLVEWLTRTPAGFHTVKTVLVDALIARVSGQ